MNRMLRKLCGSGLMLLVVAVPALAQNLTVTLASQPPASGTVSTRDADSLTLLVMSGETVSVARARGSDYRLSAGGGFFWAQVEEVPLDADSVALTPRLRDDGSVEVALAVARKDGKRQQRFQSTVLLMPGEWTRLLGEADVAFRGTRVYGTRQLSRDSLFLKVEPAP
jgi:hypothetical protein